MKQLFLFISGLAAGLAAFILFIIFNNYNTIKTASIECYTATVEDGSIMHRVKCPEGVNDF